MKTEQRIAVIIPALNEEQTIGVVVAGLPKWVDRIIVVDNGSVDGTAAVARGAGADVVREEQRGYGSACLAGIAALEMSRETSPVDVVVFMDGDGSDAPEQIESVVAPILSEGYELVIGARRVESGETGALTSIQRAGNWLSCRLVWLLFGAQYSDLGPFRAVRWEALERLDMDDRGFGWTVQMQLRAARKHLHITEVPVSYRQRRGGRSKISGSVSGAIGAGTTILSTILFEAIDHAAQLYLHTSLRRRGL